MLRNGISYSWGDVNVLIPGINGPIPLTGIMAINYKEEQEMENNYGGGNFPIAQGLGQFKYEGSIELYTEEIVNILAVAPFFNKIQSFPPFSIVVTYGNDTQALIIDRLVSVLFKENPFDVKAGDKRIVRKIPLLIGNIAWGAK